MPNWKNRVVVTGVGLVSPIGTGKDSFWEELIAGTCGIGPVTQFDASSYPCKYAAEIKNFDAKTFMSPKEIRRSSRSSQLSLVSAHLATEDAALKMGEVDPHRVGIVYGTALGPMDVIERFCSLFYERGLRKVNPFFLGMINKNAMVGELAKRFRVKGYNLSIASGCSSGNVAIATAYKAVACGLSDVMITGGVDTPITPSIFGLYAASQSLSTLNGTPQGTMCPYDKRRAGFILGEGAGTLILETLDHAVRRGARIYAELLSASITNDGEDSVTFSPNEKEMVVAFETALGEAGISHRDVDYICSHAHSSVVLDEKETRVIKEVFREHAYRLHVSTIKAMIGHSMAGGTAMQSIAACLALHNGVLPPTINYEIQDPQCDLDYVPNEARKKEIQVAMVDSFGLGGTNVAMVFRKM
jgi:3-oxoacyl-[acyl-carrier-protein] synthase II